ncbi:MAG: hypothetical protein PWP64_1583 [Candidatus Cloacimonadota bacterium]|nr:hypothetical protein [Candidatus Cloacimonadota bacterium]
MIRISAGKREVWPGFSLIIPQALEFHPGSQYFLKGDNGSGKSSFIHRILLPLLQQRDDLYIICLQQQMYLQIHALSALAAVFKPDFFVRNEDDVWRYLWDDLAAQKDSLPVFVIADEAHRLNIPEAMDRPLCLIFSSHRYQREAAHKLEFVAQNPYESRIDV